MTRPARRGFTLLELLLAMTITGLVTVIALVAADVGLASGERVSRHVASTEAQLLVRSLLADALRHAVPGSGPVDTVFTMTPELLTFRSRGIPPDLGGAHEWTVTVGQDRAGLVLIAEPDNPSLSVLRTRLDQVRGMDIRVLGTADSIWTDRWSAPGILPRALKARFLDGTGTQLGAPLVVRVGTDGVR